MDHVIAPDAVIHPSARISVTDRLIIEEGAHIAANCVIEGRDIHIGQEFWMDEGAVIGGGSCYEPESSLLAGHFLHMGRGSFINTARRVQIGHEVGLGMDTRIFTHGAYLSALDGFPVTFRPVTIGDNVWIPGATVNPGVTIEGNTVIAVGSVVTESIPYGSLAGGVPCKVIRPDAYPRPLMGTRLEHFWRDFLRQFDFEVAVGAEAIRIRDTFFYPDDKHITGPVTEQTEKLRNELRRNGIRFYSRPLNGEYRDWA